MKLTAFDKTAPLGGGASDAGAYRHCIEQACIADQGGLDGYFLTEHHSNPGLQIVPSPHLLVAALSQCTTQIRLGAMCTNLTLHHPARVAEEIRMMDLLSAGRLEMGFGRGSAALEHDSYGVAPADTRALFDHSLAIVRQLLTDGRLDRYEGGPWHGRGIVLAPEPTQRPHPPFWIAAASDASIRMAAELGLNLCTHFLDAEGVRRTRDVYEGAWEVAHAGRPCGRYGTLQHVFVAETEDEAHEVAGHHLTPWLGAGARIDRAVAEGRIVCGAPDQCVDQLLSRSRWGVDMFQGWFQFAELDHEASNRSLRLFCEEVAPAVRAALGPPPPVAAQVLQAARSQPSSSSNERTSAS